MDFAEIIFYGIPFLAVALFVAALVKYLIVRRTYRGTPTEATEQAFKKWRTVFIVAAGLFGVFLAVVITFTVLIMMAVAYM